MKKKTISVSSRINKHYEFLPILQNNFLKTRMTDSTEITKDSKKLTLTFHYSPISIGKLRLLLHVEHALKSLKQLGFSKKDIDEVKGIFSDTNVYLLCGTIFVGSIHVSELHQLLDKCISAHCICLVFFRFFSIFYPSKMTSHSGDVKRVMLDYRYGQRCGEVSVKL